MVPKDISSSEELPMSEVDSFSTVSSQNEDNNIFQDVSGGDVEEKLIDLVKKSLEDKMFQNKINIPLTKEVTDFINKVVSHNSNVLSDIEMAIIETLKDSKIDSKDIPNLIIIIKTIYKFIYSLRNAKLHGEKCGIMTSITLKYLLRILVVTKKIKIDEDKKEEFFYQIDTLIDSCVSLLSFPKTIKIKNCFKKLF